MKLYTTTGWLVLALVMAGCTINSDFSDTRYRCDVSGECPGGFACVAGYCEASQEDAGVDPDGGGVSSKKCGTVEMVVEDFEGAEMNGEHWGMWVDQLMLLSVEQRDGQLAFEIPTEIASVGSGYHTRSWYRFTGSRAFVEVVDAQEESDMGLSFHVRAPESEGGGNRWYTEQRAGTLRFWERIDGRNAQLASVSYDPVAHRWWQIREQDGVVYWETSADATTWATHAMMPTELAGEPVQVRVETWVSNPQPVPRTFLIDNLNGGISPGIRWCPAATFTDDFDDGIMKSEWLISGNGACMTREQDGQLVFDYSEPSTGSCGYYTRSRFDLSDSTLAVAAPSADVGAMYVYIGAFSRNGDELEIRQGQGELVGRKRVQETSDRTFAFPYDPVQHRWWRLRGNDGTAYWETSADGKTWTTHASHSNPPLQLDRLEIRLWSYSNDGGLDNLGNGFDNLNLAPAP
jgi:hypothetical protein